VSRTSPAALGSTSTRIAVEKILVMSGATEDTGDTRHMDF